MSPDETSDTTAVAAGRRARWLALAVARVVSLVVAVPAAVRAEPGSADAGAAGAASELAPLGEPAAATTADGGAPPAIPAAVEPVAAPAPAATLAAAPPPPPPPEKPVWKQAWFWGAIGIIAILGGVAALVLTHNPGRPSCPTGFTCPE